MANQNKVIRILTAKTALDPHWRGIVVVNAALRDAGMEVIYGGMLSAAEIAKIAVQEDVDSIGLSIGGRLGVVQQLMELLRQDRGLRFLVVAGGTVPPEDVPLLKEWGVAEFFPPGSRLDSIVDFVRSHVGLN